MEFPPPWDIFPKDQYPLAVPRDPGQLGMELMALVRPTGRILDHFRVAIGGNVTINLEVDLFKLIPAAAELPKWRMSYQIWGRDIVIRQGMTTSKWMDVYGLLASNEAASVDERGQPIENHLVLAALDGVADKTSSNASIRWAVGVDENLGLELLCQGLPASAGYLAGKPMLNG